jgi:hypothetical protein
VLDAKLADALVKASEGEDVLRVTFSAFDDKFKNKGLSIRERVDTALKSVHEYGRKSRNPLYESLDATPLTDSLYYSGEGLPPAYCVALFVSSKERTRVVAGKGHLEPMLRSRLVAGVGAKGSLRGVPRVGAGRKERQRRQRLPPPPQLVVHPTSPMHLRRMGGE